MRHKASGKSTTACEASVRLVLGERNLEHAPYAPREDDVQVAAEAGELCGDSRRKTGGPRSMTAPGIGAVTITGVVGPPRAWISALREEMLAKTVEHASDPMHEGVGTGGRARFLQNERAQFLGEQREARMQSWPVVQKGLGAAVNRREDVSQPRYGIPAETNRLDLLGSSHKEAPEHIACNQATLEQHGQTLAQLRLAELREHEPDCRIVAGERSAYAQGGVEALVEEAEHLGLVRHGKARIEVGLQRELAQQTQAERVDCTDGDLAHAVAELPPPDRIDLTLLRRAPQVPHDASAHLGSGLPRERHREDVAGVDAGFQQVGVAVHEHTGLPRSR